MWLRTLEAQLGVLRQLSAAIVDRRHPSYVVYSYDTLIRQRVFQIACGHEDANDCNTLRHDSLFKAACDRLPLSTAQFNIVQSRLIKVAVKVRELATQVTLSFSSAFPLQSVYHKIMVNLARAAP